MLVCYRKLECGPCIAVIHARRANVSAESEQTVLLLLTPYKLYLLDRHSNTLQQHFPVECTQLTRRDTQPLHGSSRLAEIHLVPQAKSAVKTESGALSPSSFPTVEYYLKLSQLEAQTDLLPFAAASGNADGDDNINSQSVASQSDAEKCETTSNVIVLLVCEREATRFLSIYHSMRSHILEPDLRFCVYGSVIATATGEPREESFFSASSQPTL